MREYDVLYALSICREPIRINEVHRHAHLRCHRTRRDRQDYPGRARRPPAPGALSRGPALCRSRRSLPLRRVRDRGPCRFIADLGADAAKLPGDETRLVGSYRGHTVDRRILVILDNAGARAAAPAAAVGAALRNHHHQQVHACRPRGCVPLPPGHLRRLGVAVTVQPDRRTGLGWRRGGRHRAAARHVRRSAACRAGCGRAVV